MRFTSAFVSILLSASTTLAQANNLIPPPPPSHVAGIKVINTSVNFEKVSGKFRVPHIECHNGLGVAYVGAAIDDAPSNCPGSLEVGVSLRCEGDKTIYQAYSRYYPLLEIYHPKLLIDAGDEIYVNITRNYTGIYFFVENESYFESTGSLTDMGGPDLCGASVSWFLRGDIIIRTLQAIPKFEPVKLYKMVAIDQASREYKVQPGTPGAPADVEWTNIGYHNGIQWTNNTYGPIQNADPGIIFITFQL